jgi:starch synthase
MNIFHISAECYPVAKVGGLGDVVGALPKYLNQIGENASVVMPAYYTKFVQTNDFTAQHHGKMKLGYFILDYTIYKESTDKLGFPLYVVAIPGLFDRPEVYSYPDDTERFMAFQIAFLNWLTETQNVPDVIHCHDHHSGLIPFMVQFCHPYHQLKNVPTLITIHNGQYQGWFGWDKLHYIPDFPYQSLGYLQWDNIINPLASAIKCAWKVTTVSNSYLDELSEKCNGLENLLKFERYKSIGILNGIDQEIWNPETDSMLDIHYNYKTFAKGKAANKKLICEQFGLNNTKPLFCFIGRLVDEKGADLLPQIFYNSLHEHYKEINILMLGSGNAYLENQLDSLKYHFGGNYNTFIGYNEKLAHIIYAASDFILMPSKVEPCGLNQMYALRYGTIPIVRRIGGLKDTIIDIGEGGFGICHDQASVWDVNYSISRAKNMYENKELIKKIVPRIMQINHSWENVAQTYLDVYRQLVD